MKSEATDDRQNKKVEPPEAIAPTKPKIADEKPKAAQTKPEDDKEKKDPHAAGTKLGSYVFGKNLGKGTFGKVKLATH